MEEELFKVQIVRRSIINKLGLGISIASVLIFFGVLLSIKFYVTYSALEFEALTLGCGALFIVGVWLKSRRRYELAKLQFLPEGIMMITTAGYIPLKYEDLKSFRVSDHSSDPDKTYFYLDVKDGRSYEIKADSEIYEGLIGVFPDKEA